MNRRIADIAQKPDEARPPSGLCRLLSIVGMVLIAASCASFANISRIDCNRASTSDATGTQTRNTFDEANRLLDAQSNDGASTLSWRPDGLLESITHSNGVRSTYQYDNAKQLTRIVHSRNNVATLTLQYSYDSNGNRLTDGTKTPPKRDIHDFKLHAENAHRRSCR